MRICNGLRGAIFVGAVALAAQALAFEVKDLNADTPPAEAFRFGLDSYRSGDKQTAAEALNFAAERGNAGAQWKLGRMYAEGDGVERDDYRAFELFNEVAAAHADDEAGRADPSAPYVSDAFVQLGTYFKSGIPDSGIKPDPSRARGYFAHAAVYFGDSDAQLNLARMYYNGEGGVRDLNQAAKWAKLSADKGNSSAQALLVAISLDLTRAYLDGQGVGQDLRQATRWAKRAADYGSIEGQAMLGYILFEGDGASRRPVDGLTLLTIALARSDPDERWIMDMHEQARSTATENEWNTAKLRAEEWLADNPMQ
jgi:TPR repeat protein